MDLVGYCYASSKEALSNAKWQPHGKYNLGRSPYHYAHVAISRIPISQASFTMGSWALMDGTRHVEASLGKSSYKIFVVSRWCNDSLE